jgi:hypothetical protein
MIDTWFRCFVPQLDIGRELNQKTTQLHLSKDRIKKPSWQKRKSI